MVCFVGVWRMCECVYACPTACFTIQYLKYVWIYTFFSSYKIDITYSMQSCRATHILSFLPTTTTTTATHTLTSIRWYVYVSMWVGLIVFGCLLVCLCCSLSVAVAAVCVVVNAVMGERAYGTVYVSVCLIVYESGGWFSLLCLLELYDYAAFQWLSMAVCVPVCVNDVNCSLLFLLLSIFVNFVVVVQRPYLIQTAHFVRSPVYVCVPAVYGWKEEETK